MVNKGKVWEVHTDTRTDGKVYNGRANVEQHFNKTGRVMKEMGISGTGERKSGYEEGRADDKDRGTTARLGPERKEFGLRAVQLQLIKPDWA